MSPFPVTDWQRLEALRAGSEQDKRAVFEELFLRYRQPVLGFLRRKGYGAEQAEDLVQDFFTYCLTDRVFEQADAARGRFRNLMLTALQRYAAKQHRHDMAQMRRPDGGLVSSDTAGTDGAPIEVGGDGPTPEGAFERAWAQALLARVLGRLRQEFTSAGRGPHFNIFERCVVKPLLEGQPVPPHQELAREHGLTEKEVGNRLITAKRAYQRLLREDVAAYARGEQEVDDEIRELFLALAR